MTSINIDFQKAVGKMKPMHAVGQPPYTGGFLSFDFTHIRHLEAAGMPYSRLHDVGGAFGGNRFVDIPNIFRDFDADETLEENYDFAFTDVLIEALEKYHVKPIFRLGVTIENQAHIKAYRIHPPKDYGKWARICEHIVRHYNEGWANGFYYGIEYWEIWNEPENGVAGRNQMWTGTAEQYFELYDVAAKHLKACFGDTIKVGGYGTSGLYGIFYHPDRYDVPAPQRERDDRYETAIHRVNFLLGFLEYIKAHHSPLDFFSYHSYLDVEQTAVITRFVRRELVKNGYGAVEMHLNEWNNAHTLDVHGRSVSSAAVAAMMCKLQNEDVQMLCYYDTRIQATPYGGIFNAYTCQPVCTYYSFVAFNELYRLGTQVSLDFDEEGLYGIAATNGKECAVLLCNYTEEEREIAMPQLKGFSAYLVDEAHFMTEKAMDPTSFTIGANQVLLFKGC